MRSLRLNLHLQLLSQESNMNHQRFKFYKHSTEYYRSLYNTVTELEDQDIVPVLTQYPSTINRKRRSTFVKKCKSIPTKVC